MDLVGKVVDDATSIEQADIDRLRALGLSDQDILDVVLAAAARCFFSNWTRWRRRRTRTTTSSTLR